MVDKRKLAMGLIATVAAALGLSLALGSGQARSASGCTHVTGRVLDEHHINPDVAIGRVVGDISGRYEFTVGPLGGSDPGATVLFGTGSTTISTKKGSRGWPSRSTSSGPKTRISNGLPIGGERTTLLGGPNAAESGVRERCERGVSGVAHARDRQGNTIPLRGGQG